MMDQRELAAYKPTQGLAQRLNSIIAGRDVEMCLERALEMVRRRLQRHEFSRILLTADERDKQPLDPRAKDALLPMIVRAEAALVGLFPDGHERMIHAGMRGLASQIARWAETETSPRRKKADEQDDNDRARILENFASSLVCRNAIAARAISPNPRKRAQSLSGGDHAG